MKLLPLTLIVSLLLASFITPAQANQAEKEAKFRTWLNQFKQQALQAGISNQTLQHAFKNVRLNHSVLESDRKQPEFTKTFFEYFDRAVSDRRILTGREKYAKHRDLLNEVTKKYGVPGRFIIAFWGMETNYGSYTGSTPIIESLATLAFDPRRTEFFTKQLIAALTIIDQGHVRVEQMKGSWAGAMGQCQFMPTNYLAYAVDGDGDGKINLWDSLPDAFHSAGNFLKHLGWQTEQTWGREVALPNSFNFALADGKTERSLTQWQALGVNKPNKQPLPIINEMKGKLLLPSDYRGPAFITYDNFQVIKRWNNSNNYAIAVGHLADRIVDKPTLSKKRPHDDKGLSRDDMAKIQQKLNQLGYNAGHADGIAGSNTRSALRAFQLDHNHPADGAPTYRMLEVLKSQTVKNVVSN